MNYPRKLSTGANNTVIVLNDTEAAKLFIGDKIFEKYIEIETKEIRAFREYFFNR